MIIFLGNKEEHIEPNSTAADLAKKLNLTAPNQALAVYINDILYDLDHPLSENDTVRFLSFEEDGGKDLFWHSSAHVLAQAVMRLWPEAEPTIGPSIESGFYYDFANLHISDNDFEKIEKEVKKIIKENLKPQRIVFANKQEATKAFSNSRYKKELIEGFVDDSTSAYKQGEFIDLCRGPHLPNIGKIKAFKVLKTSGAYWRGDQDNEVLTRIYGISYPDKKQLAEYLQFLEEAKKRDHKKLGQLLGLFSIKEEAPGMPFLYPNGMIMWENLLTFLRECLNEADYKEIKTPLLLNKELWVKSGHWSHYRENMYTLEVDNREVALKPMNCPGCMLYYKSTNHSYRELPMRVSEIGHVHRHELSGALNGLFRVRGFHQDDAHVFMRPEDIQSEIVNILSLIEKVYMTFGLSFFLELSTRPEKSIGTDEDWERATEGLKGALNEWGHSYSINEGDGAFYGPKIDVHIQDVLKRRWQCATIQLDMSLPEKFELEYIDSDSTRKRPVMIHRTIYGSIERFLGILIEHFGGKFPLWLSPLGVRIIPVADRHVEYAKKLQEKLKEINMHCDVDEAHESVSKKIRNAQILKINYMLTVGDSEIENNTVSVRTRDNVVHGEIAFEQFLQTIVKEYKERSLMPLFSQSI